MAGALEDILRILFRPVNDHTTRKIGELMATVEEIRDQVAAQIADVKSSLTAAVDRVAADFENFKNQAADVDPAAFQPITDGLNEIKSSLDALDPVPDAVTEAPIEGTGEEAPVEQPPPEGEPPA